MIKLVGVQRIPAKNSGEVFAKLHFLDNEPSGSFSGCATFSEFTKWKDEFLDYIDQEVRVSYSKGYNGMAYVDAVIPL